MTQTKELPAVLQINGLDELHKMGKLMATSLLFGDKVSDTEVARACVKILAGAEYGFGPFVSMKTMHIIQGSPAPSYQMVATLIKRSGKYNFKVLKRENDGCELEWLEKIDGEWQSMGKSKYDKADAQNAGLLNKDNWKKWPRQMYFSRALTEGANVYATEVFGGPIFTPGELNVAVDQEGTPVTDGHGNYVQDAEIVDEKKQNKGRSRGSSSAAQPAAESSTSGATDVQVVDPKSSSSPKQEKQDGEQPIDVTVTVVEPPKPADAKSPSPPSSEQTSPATSATPSDTSTIQRPGQKELGDILQAGLGAGKREEQVEQFLLELLEKKGVDCSSEETIFATWTFEHVTEAINGLLGS